ncbi:ion transporter [Sneathiella chinensis]|uniref:Ion transporter n=2 Tax=Sneathiella chinensis TaxID=349750 RepID=A0ABQ5U4M9_9PROT|nr:ion transporter [Sneathiella chinensis]
MLLQLFLGSILIIICVINHAFCLEFLLRRVKRFGAVWEVRAPAFGHVLIMIVVVLGLFMTHTIEAWIWASFYHMVGETTTMHDAIYFSTVTFTTLGFGDITLSPDWQLTSALQAVSGIILFGWSTAFLVNVRGLFWRKHDAIHTPSHSGES